MLKKYSLIILIFYALICAACFSPWEGDNGTVNIRIGGGNTGGRNIIEEWIGDDPSLIRFSITLEGPGPKQTREDIEYGKSVKFSVTPGLWNISVKAEEVNQGDDGETIRNLIAIGSKNMVITSGLNNVVIQMQPIGEININITINPFIITFESIVDSDEQIINISSSKIEEDGNLIIRLDTPEQYDSIEWRCKGITGSGDYFILNKEYASWSEYEEEYYYLLVEVWKDGIPYSKAIIIKIIYDNDDDEE